jgi:hypothetical protein
VGSTAGASVGSAAGVPHADSTKMLISRRLRMVKNFLDILIHLLEEVSEAGNFQLHNYINYY